MTRPPKIEYEFKEECVIQKTTIYNNFVCYDWDSYTYPTNLTYAEYYKTDIGKKQLIMRRFVKKCHV